jgi:predicted  nucleic acid-binding Zn-ribbon protein
VLRSFIKGGLDCGDRAFHLVDPEHRDEHLRRLAEAEMDVEAAINTGQLQVQVWEPGRPEGRGFDPDFWLGSFQRALESGPEAGYARTRFLGHMGWAHADAADDEDWFEFEARLNEVLGENEETVICAYDLTAIGAGVVIDALRTHSAVILGGLLQENPFFAPPDQFVREIRERRGRRAHVGR